MNEWTKIISELENANKKKKEEKGGSKKIMKRKIKWMNDCTKQRISECKYKNK